jgi:hypothetical protein
MKCGAPWIAIDQNLCEVAMPECRSLASFGRALHESMKHRQDDTRIACFAKRILNVFAQAVELRHS